jgi:prolyl oligopeptidase
MVILLSASCGRSTNENLKYPDTRKGDVADTIFGVPVADPYRWLEDDMSEETEEWVKARNNITFGYLDKISYRDQIRERLMEIWNYEKFSIPFREGDYIYFAKNDGLQNQYVYYRQKEGGEPELFLDPNSFSADGTTSLAEMGFSKDGSRLAYSISEGGSDWRKIIVMDTDSKQIIGDTIKDVKFSGISWRGNEGFYYSSYDKPQGSELSAKTDHHKLYFHKMGTSQKEDKVVFGSDIKRRYVDGTVTEDDRFLIVTAAESTTGNELYIMDLTVPNSSFIAIAGNFDNEHYVINNEGSRLFISTNLNAPNRKIVTVNANNPGIENWIDLIPETENVLNPATASGYLFAHYLRMLFPYLKQLTSTQLFGIECPVGNCRSIPGKIR